MDFFEKTIDLRIEATREAQKRSRLALIVLAIASIIIVLSEFNVCLSWSRGFAVEQLPPSDKPSVAFKLRETARNEWVKRQNVNISLLGINIAADDLPILGPLTLIPLYIWFLFCLRSEYLAIGLLLRTPPHTHVVDWGWLTYYAVASFGVFSNFREDTLVENPAGRNLRYGGIFTCLLLFPIIAIGIGVVLDLLELFVLVPVFRDVGPAASLWSGLPRSEVAYVIVYWVIDFLVLLRMFGFFKQARRLSAGSEELVGNHLRKVRDLREPLAEPRMEDD